VRGNSLIGAGRRLYPPEKLAKAQWLKSAPVDVQFSAGEIPDGYIHHFLLPAEGWGCVAGEKEARELAPEDTKRLADWRKSIRRSPSGKKTVQRLQALAGRTEYLWSLVIERLRISEREISRAIDVWGAEDLPMPQEAIPRDKVLADLRAPGTPFWRLKTVMDAWCALWFWPVEKAGLLDSSDGIYVMDPVPLPEPVAPAPSPGPAEPFLFPPTYFKDALFGDDQPVQLSLGDGAPRKTAPRKPKIIRRPQVALKDIEDWLDFAESVLGRQDIPEDSLVGEFHNLADITEYEDELEPWMGMDSFTELAARFPWLDTVTQIAKAQGFFHWELRFAQVFSDGGFDLQLGNPPWVRPEWDENVVLAERDPWFKLADGVSVDDRRARKDALLANEPVRQFFLAEFTATTGIASFLADPATYPLISGTQPDFYRGFMCRTWSHTGPYGTVGLLHPDTHLEGVREGRLRAAAYHRLRMHGSFVNGGNWAFPLPLGNSLEFGMHIYASASDVYFLQASSLYGAAVFTESLGHDGSGDLPRVKYQGHWDLRPHQARIIRVDVERLSLWQALLDRRNAPLDETPLVHVVSGAELGAMTKLAAYSSRLGDRHPRISSGFHEMGAKKTGLIKEEVSDPRDWAEVVLQGPHFFVATPFAKQPPDMGRQGKLCDLTKLGTTAVATTKYRRACDLESYRAAQDRWTDYTLSEPVTRPYTEFYRLVWREMIADNSERSLMACIMPPGPTHIHAVCSMAFATNLETALNSGFWASLALDYLLRVTGRGHLNVSDARTMLAPQSGHPLASDLLLRTLRLNCLTDAYAGLWHDLYQPTWQAHTWALGWPNLQSLGRFAADWTRDTPLRTDYERRAALVEIDALVAVWVGWDVDEFLAAYESRFSVLADHEAEMYFDVNGRKLAADYNQWGHGQTKEHWKQFELYLEDPDRNPPPEGYAPPFYKADRVAEYRQAHAVFSERLRRANARESDMR
jgi:hypothetical protein